MPKNKKQKKDKELRRTIEVMKAQLKDSPTKKDTSAIEVKPDIKETSNKINPGSFNTDDTLIKKDLYKTIFLSACAFAAIAVLYALDITSF